MASAIAIHRYTLRISIGNAAESDMLSLCLIFSSKSLMFIIVCFMVYTMVTAKSMPPHCKYKKIYSSALLFLLLFATPPLFLSFITNVTPTDKGLLPVSAIVVLSTSALAPAPAAIPHTEGTEKVPFFYDQNGKCLRFVTSLSANRLK